MWSFLLSLLAATLQRIGLAWWQKHEMKQQVQEQADAAISDQEEEAYWRNKH